MASTRHPSPSQSIGREGYKEFLDMLFNNQIATGSNKKAMICWSHSS